MSHQTPKSKEGITMKRILEIGGVVAGVVLIAFGAAAIVLAHNGQNTVASALKFQQITGTPDMTPAAITAEAKSAGLDIAKTPIPTCSVANVPILTGDQARCFGEYMQVHTLEATHGVPYALMPRYATADGKGTDDAMKALQQNGQPVANSARDIWVTYTSLTGALNASYMAEQMANFGIVVGVALLLSGLGFIVLALGGALENQWAFAKKSAGKTVEAGATPLNV
jgi:hypothetical protein